MSNLTRALAGALVAGAFVLAACGAPAGQTPPAADATPQVGASYRVTMFCPESIPLGTTWWSFDETNQDWPPREQTDVIMTPYPVPGVVTLISENKAVFRADVNGAQFGLTRTPTRTVFGCI
jgi:hypothetical protein